MSGHIHAALMLQYAMTAAEHDRPFEHFQKQNSEGQWKDMTVHPTWDKGAVYRIKPQMATINGMEVPETRVQLSKIKVGAAYYVESPTEETFFEEVFFDDTDWDKRIIARGAAHTTATGAALFCRARLGLSESPEE